MLLLDQLPVKGALFDLDDTLLDNGKDPNLHAYSRLIAVHSVGEEYGIAELTEFPSEQNVLAFRTAREHTLEGGVWNILYMSGLVPSLEIDPSNELLKEIVRRKNELHGDVLRKRGQEIPGAIDFVKFLGKNGLQNHLGIVSGAIRRDVDIFTEKYDIVSLIPDQRIVSRELITLPKPHKQSFDRGFQALGLPDGARRNVLAFEDDPKGIQSAHDAGLFVCAITTRFTKEDLLAAPVAPDLVFDSYPELRKHFSLVT